MGGYTRLYAVGIFRYDVRPLFFIKRYLYYTKRHTNTKRSPYRNLLDAYRRDRCTHKLTQMTLKEKKITTESLQLAHRA